MYVSNARELYSTAHGSKALFRGLYFRLIISYSASKMYQRVGPNVIKLRKNAEYYERAEHVLYALLPTLTLLIDKNLPKSMSTMPFREVFYFSGCIYARD